MKMTPVKSSNIEAIGYDADKQQLDVTFKNGKTFGYADVSTIYYRELVNSDSVGKFFNKHIKSEKKAFEVLDADADEPEKKEELKDKLSFVKEKLKMIERIALHPPVDRCILKITKEALLYIKEESTNDNP